MSANSEYLLYPTESHCIGTRYGRLVVVGPTFRIRVSHRKKSGKVCHSACACVVAMCDCGNYAIKQLPQLKVSRGLSCGCGHSLSPVKHGESRTRLYNIWASMKERGRKGSSRAKRYADRGIEVCEEWTESYESFRDWSFNNGYADGLSIDRIDVNGNYEPSNCRWATAVVQMNNRRTNVSVEAFGESLTIAQLSRHPLCAVNLSKLRKRIKAGWEPELAATAKHYHQRASD